MREEEKLPCFSMLFIVTNLPSFRANLNVFTVLTLTYPYDKSHQAFALIGFSSEPLTNDFLNNIVLQSSELGFAEVTIVTEAKKN
jgi:hypothetical protein